MLVADKVRFYGFTGSNSVYTGRLLLEHKGIDYAFVRLPPAAHAAILLLRGFPTMGAPALKVGARRVQGTRWIARALDELYPDNPLFPADPAACRAVQDAERWGEELQNAVRRIFYCAGRRDRQAFMSVLGAGRGALERDLVMSEERLERQRAALRRAPEGLDVELLLSDAAWR